VEHTPKHKHYFEWEIHTPPQTNPNNSVGLQIATRTEVGIGTGNHLPVQSEPDQSNFGGTPPSFVVWVASGRFIAIFAPAVVLSSATHCLLHWCLCQSAVPLELLCSATDMSGPA